MMLRVRLFCNQGMSTALLVNKMREAAVHEGIELDVAAYPVSELAERIEGVDVVLVGPQVSYLEDSIAAVCEARGVPMGVVPIVDYGMCDGPAVLAFACKLASM